MHWVGSFQVLTSFQSEALVDPMADGKYRGDAL